MAKKWFRVVRVEGERSRRFTVRKNYDNYRGMLKELGYEYDRKLKKWVVKKVVIPQKGFEKKLKEAVEKKDVKKVKEIPKKEVKVMWRGAVAIHFTMRNCYFSLNVHYFDIHRDHIDLDRLMDYAESLLEGLTGWHVDENWTYKTTEGEGIQKVNYRQNLNGRLEWWIDVDDGAKCWNRFGKRKTSGYEIDPFNFHGRRS